jgi:hypothetical protein
MMKKLKYLLYHDDKPIGIIKEQEDIIEQLEEHLVIRIDMAVVGNDKRELLNGEVTLKIVDKDKVIVERDCHFTSFSESSTPAVKILENVTVITRPSQRSVKNH